VAREESGDAVPGGDLAGVLEPEGEKGGGRGREGGTDFFGVEIAVGEAGHVLSEGEADHSRGDGGLDDGLERVFGMARTELPGVTVH
jgi:hypothetical protein